MFFSDLKTLGVDKIVEENEKVSKTESNEYLMMNPLQNKTDEVVELFND